MLHHDITFPGGLCCNWGRNRHLQGPLYCRLPAQGNPATPAASAPGDKAGSLRLVFPSLLQSPSQCTSAQSVLGRPDSPCLSPAGPHLGKPSSSQCAFSVRYPQEANQVSSHTPPEPLWALSRGSQGATPSGPRTPVPRARGFWGLGCSVPQRHSRDTRGILSLPSPTTDFFLCRPQTGYLSCVTRTRLQESFTINQHLRR